jgi:hypothetical protein
VAAAERRWRWNREMMVEPGVVQAMVCDGEGVTATMAAAPNVEGRIMLI